MVLALMGATASTSDDSVLNPVFRTMKTRGFAIGDEENESRIVAHVPEGDPQLVLLDRKQAWKATLSVRNGTPAMVLAGGLRRPLMVLRVDEHGPAIVMADEKYKATWQAPPRADAPGGSEAGTE